MLSVTFPTKTLLTMESLNIGPLAVPIRPVLFAIAVFAALTVGSRIAKRRGMDIERAMWSVLFVGLASARLAFVLVYWRSYGDHPWTIIDIRDGGMNTTVGIAGAILMAILFAVRNQAWRRPLLVSLFTGLTLWAGMTTALELNRPHISIPAIVLPDLSGDQIALESFQESR